MRRKLIGLAFGLCCFMTDSSYAPAVEQGEQKTPFQLQYVRRSHQPMTSLNLRTDQPITVWVTMTMRPDCNQYSFSPNEFRTLEPTAGADPLEQDFEASVGVLGTMVFCRPPFPTDRPDVVFKSDVLVIYPKSGAIISKIYVPSGYQLHVSQ